MDYTKGSTMNLKQHTQTGKSPMQSTKDSKVRLQPGTKEWGEEYCRQHNAAVMEEHERDLAQLPPEVRASRTPEEWLKTDTLQILKMIRLSKERNTSVAAQKTA